MILSSLREKLLVGSLMVLLTLPLTGCVYVVIGSLGALGGYVVSPDTVEGLVEGQGWGVRVAQENGCGTMVAAAISRILSDRRRFESMSRKALDHSPANSAAHLVSDILETLGGA